MADYTPGKREFAADFVGTAGSNLSLTKRPDAISFDYMTAFCQGPVALGDSSQGLMDYVWRARSDGLNVWISRGSPTHTWEAETLLFATTGIPITEIDVAFEEAGRPVICATRATGLAGASEVWLYWFKPTLAAFAFESFGLGRDPRVLLDYPPDPSIADVLLFYMLDGSGLVYRLQRSLYANVLTTPVFDATNLHLEEVAYMESWQIGVFFSEHKVVKGQYLLRHLETAPYPIPVRDDGMQFAASLLAGELRPVIMYYIMDEDVLGSDFSCVSGTLFAPIMYYTTDTDQMASVFTLQSGTCGPAIINHTLYDIDKVLPSIALQSGTCIVVLVSHTLYDVDKMTSDFTLQSGTLV